MENAYIQVLHLLTESHILNKIEMGCLSGTNNCTCYKIIYFLNHPTQILSLTMQTVVSVWLMMSASLLVGP